MSKIKIVFWIVLLASLYFLFAIYSPFLNEKNRKNIIILDTNVIHYSNNKWSFVDTKSLEEIEFLNTYVYNFKNEFIEKVDLKYSKKWIVKKGFKYVDYGGITFGYNGLNNARLEPFYREDATSSEKELLKPFIKQYKKQDLSDDFNAMIIKANIDNDDEIELIYEFSTLSFDNPSYDAYSMIVIYNDGEFEVLDTLYVSSIKMDSLYSFMLYKIIDVDGDGICEFITIDSPYSEAAELKFSLYQKKNNNYELLATNREGE